MILVDYRYIRDGTLKINPRGGVVGYPTEKTIVGYPTKKVIVGYPTGKWRGQYSRNSRNIGVFGSV